MNLPQAPVYYNSKIAKFILQRGFSTIMLFGMIFTKLPQISEKTKIHEETHAAQWQDCVGIGFVFNIIALFTLFSFDVREYWMFLFVPMPFVLFYIIYGIEWIINIIFRKMTPFEAYLNIGFEKQARWCASTWNLPCEQQNFYSSLKWWSKRF